MPNKIFPSRIAAQGSFKRQIILTFVAGFLLLVTAFTIYQFRSERAFLYRESTNETISLAQSLAASSRSWVLANDVAGLQEVVHAFQTHPELSYAMIISPEGQLLAHSDATKVGQYVTDISSLALLKSPPVNKIMVDDETMSDIAVPIMLDQRFIGWARLGQTRSVIAGNLHKIMLSSMLFVLISVVLVLFAALFIANRLGYRIGRLMRVAEDVQSGNYSTRANILGEDEVAKLAISLNHMLDVLARDEEQLRKASLYTRSLIEASLDPLVTISPEGKITDVNKATEEATGRLRSELVGTDFSDYFTEPDRARQGYQQVFLKGSVIDYPLALRHRNGHVTEVLYNASIYRDEAGEVLGVFAAARDITERKNAEFVLRQSEEGLKEAQRLAHMGSWYLDIATNQVFWSEELYKMYGFDPAQSPPVYTESMKLFTPESWEKLSTAIAQAVEVGTPYELELETVRKDGGIGWMLARGEQVRNERGVPVRVRGVAMDITGRKQAEERIRRINERYSLSNRAARLGVWDWDLQKNELVWDDRMYELYGVKREDFAGAYEAWLQGIHPDDRAASDEISKQARRGEREYDTEFRVVWPDGSIRYLKAYGQFVRDADGKPMRMIGVNLDITERKQAELKLRDSEQAFRALSENSPDVIVRYDREGRRIYVNPEFERVNHLRAQDVLGKTPAELSTELKPKVDEFTKRLMAAMESGTASQIDLTWTKNGKLVCWFVRVVPEFDADGKVVSALTIWSDISERKQAEDEIREKEERLALATINNGVGIWDWDLQTQQLIWDDSMYSLYHIRREDFSGTEEAWRASLHPDDLTRGDKEVEAAITGVRPFNTEFRVVWPNGEIRHIKAVAKVFHDDQGKPLRMLGINTDITERKLAEEQLRELNNDFVTLLENTGDFIYFKGKDSRIRFCSQTLANITGHHSWREMIGKHDLEVFPKDVAQIYYEEELPIFREGKALLNKTDPYYDDQGKPGWVNTNKWPVFGDDKKTVVGIFGISRDITELKEAEDKITELNRDLEQRVDERTAQLEAANKELESFSYSVSHDLRTPLRAIDGFSHILLEDYADKLDEEGKRLLEVVRNNTNRMSQLIDDILQFSRTGRLGLTFSEIDMERLVREVAGELQPDFESGKLQLEIEAIPQARGDHAMMRQVFVNLLSNAIKFSRNRDIPRIHVGAGIKGNETYYFVKDNGVGFDMKYSEKLFGVFQRLHSMEEFEGTGIGLAIVKRIINRHGGRVWAEGKINEGATIYFTLPQAARQSA